MRLLSTPLKICLLLLTALFIATPSKSQCTRTPPTANTCPVILGTPIIADGGLTNNNVHGAGAIFYYNLIGGTAKVTMTNDGVLDVCGNLTITASSTFNLSSGGTIQVESGGSLTINTGVTLNNTGQIVNRGTLTINGDINVTNVNATIWNISTSGNFTVGVAHSVSMGSGSYFINNSSFANSIVTIPTLNLAGGFLCMGDMSIVNTQSLVSTSNNNAVLYSGSISSGCLGVSSTGTIAGKTLTSSASINVCLATGFSYSSGTSANWGSALVNNNCSGCNIVLPLNEISLNAVQESNKIALQWNISGNQTGGEVFNIEESDDGINFHSIAVIAADQNISNYSWYDNNISALQQFYRIKLTSQNGLIVYSGIAIVKTHFGQMIAIYPNPTTRSSNINIIINSLKTATLELSLIDLSGKALFSSNRTLQNGRNQFNFSVKNILPGTYILKIHSDYLGDSYNKIIVLN
jgi:hypothetical protein